MVFLTNRRTTRLVEKNGECLVVNKIPVKDRIIGYIGDSFTGYVDLRWRYHLLIFFGTFFFAWNVIGLVWFSVPKVGSSKTPNTPEENSCISNAGSIVEAILFAYETQSTVGYGYRYMASSCNLGGYILQFLQIFVGVLLPTLIGGVVFVKSRRPKTRHETIVFSKYAVIFDENVEEKVEEKVQESSSCGERNDLENAIQCRRRRRRVFQFRLGNLRQSHIVSASLRVILVKDRQTDEGEMIPFCMHQLPICTFAVGGEDASEHPGLTFLTWPILISHEINEESALGDVGESGLNFELLVLLEGVIEPTGKPLQFRTSYTPNEIRWQHKFMPIVMEFKSSKGERDAKDIFSVDYSCFDETIPMHRTFSQEEIITKNEFFTKCTPLSKY